MTCDFLSRLQGIAMLALLISCASTLAESPQYAAEPIDVARLDSSPLDDLSIATVRALTDELEIVGYFSESVRQANNVEFQVRALLDAYAAVSHGNIRIRFVNPSDEAERAEAEAAGVPPLAFQYVTESSIGTVHGCSGLFFRYRGETRTIPVIDRPQGLEYAITLKLKELLGEKAIVGVVSGHGGPTLEADLIFLRLALPGIYELRAVDLRNEVSGDIDALLVLAPDQAFTDEELRRLNHYVMRGGSLGVFGAGVQVTLNREMEVPTAATEDMGLRRVLARWGVAVRRDLVMDCHVGCMRVATEQPSVLGMTRRAVPYPPFPTVAIDEDVRSHPAVFQVDSAEMPFVSSLELTPLAEGVSATTLMHSTEESWRERAPNLTPRGATAWVSGNDRGPFPLLVAIVGRLPNAFASSEGSTAVSLEDTRVLVGGTSEHFGWRPLFQPQFDQQRQTMLGLAVNNVNWLALQSELLALRSKTTDVVVD